MYRPPNTARPELPGPSSRWLLSLAAPAPSSGFCPFVWTCCINTAHTGGSAANIILHHTVSKTPAAYFWNNFCIARWQGLCVFFLMDNTYRASKQLANWLKFKNMDRTVNLSGVSMHTTFMLQKCFLCSNLYHTLGANGCISTQLILSFLLFICQKLPGEYGLQQINNNIVHQGN